MKLDNLHLQEKKTMGTIGLIVAFTFVVINTSGIYVKFYFSFSLFCTYDKKS